MTIKKCTHCGTEWICDNKGCTREQSPCACFICLYNGTWDVIGLFNAIDDNCCFRLMNKDKLLPYVIACGM
jgi:hypothetical protein